MQRPACSTCATPARAPRSSLSAACALPGRATALSSTPSSHCSVSSRARCARCRRKNATSAAAIPARFRGPLPRAPPPPLLLEAMEVDAMAVTLPVPVKVLEPLPALRKSAMRYCTALSKVCRKKGAALAEAAAEPAPRAEEDEEDKALESAEAWPGTGELGRLPRAARAAAAVRLCG